MLSLNDFHDYQHNSVTELYERSHVLGMMPTGAGKTAVGLTTFAELQRDGEVRRAIVLAPKRVAEMVWPTEPAKWAQIKHLDIAYVGGTPKQRMKTLAESHDVYCVCENNIKWIEEVLADTPADAPVFDLLIVDEVSRYKNPRGSWAKTLRHKLAPRFKNVWMLTGTPRPNSELDYFVPITVASQGRVWPRSYDRWRQERFYSTDYQQRDWSLHQHYATQLNADVAQYSFRVPLEVVPRPSSDPIRHNIELPAAAQEYCRQMQRDFLTRLPERDIIAFDSASSSGKLAQMAQGFLYDEDKAAHKVHTAKTDYLKELLERIGGDHVCLVYWFKEDLRRLQALIPGLAYLGHGVTGVRAREVERAWNAGETQYLAIHPASAGHGLNLQKVEAHMVHYALTWSAELYAQTVARVARQGYAGGDRLMNHLLVAEGTIDEAKILRVEGKLTAQEAAMQYIKSVLA